MHNRGNIFAFVNAAAKARLDWHIARGRDKSIFATRTEYGLENQSGVVEVTRKNCLESSGSGLGWKYTSWERIPEHFVRNVETCLILPQNRRKKTTPKGGFQALSIIGKIRMFQSQLHLAASHTPGHRLVEYFAVQRTLH